VGRDSTRNIAEVTFLLLY